MTMLGGTTEYLSDPLVRMSHKDTTIDCKAKSKVKVEDFGAIVEHRSSKTKCLLICNLK